MTILFRLFKMQSLLLLFIFINCTQLSNKNKIETTQNGATVYKVEPGPLQKRIVVDGKLVSPTSKPVSAQRVGWAWSYTVSWVAPEGSFVKEGDLLLKMESSSLAKELIDLKDKVETTTLELEEAKIRAEDEISAVEADIKYRDFELKKAKLLVSNNDSVPLVERRKQLLDVSSAEANLRRSKEKLQNVREAVKRSLQGKQANLSTVLSKVSEAESNLQKLEVRAPQEGLFLLKSYQTESTWQKAVAGASIGAGATLGEVAHPKDLIARLLVPEIDAEGIVIGSPVVLSLTRGVGKSLEGVVEKVGVLPATVLEREGGSPGAASDEVRLFDIDVRVSELPKDVLPGMTLKAEIIPFDKHVGMRIPIEVISDNGPPAAKNNVTEIEAKNKLTGTKAQIQKKAWVYCKKKGSEAWKWQEIQWGEMSFAFAEVIEGLEVGDLVVRKDD